jgi:hypothetical protein
MSEENHLTMGSEIRVSSVDYGIYSTRFFKIFFFWCDISLIECCQANAYRKQNLQTKTELAAIFVIPVLIHTKLATKVPASFVKPGSFTQFHKTCSKFCKRPGPQQNLYPQCIHTGEVPQLSPQQFLSRPMNLLIRPSP